MGKRGKRRRSGDTKQKVPENTPLNGVVVTADDNFQVYAWKSDIFQKAPTGVDETTFSTLYHLQLAWQRLEQRKRRTLIPTPIQLHVWPVLTQSYKSVVGIAPTGSGKTLAYGLHVGGTLAAGNALVLVPTRELARQVEKELKIVSEKTILCIYGGVDRAAQVEALTEAIQSQHQSWIVTATTGRLVDILEEDSLPPFKVDSVILDEADRMASNADMARQVDEILQEGQRQQW